MYFLLLFIIYVAFVSLGLPDSMLGAAWPSMRQSLDLPLSLAGVISIIVTLCIICSCLMVSWLTRRLGTPLLTAISVLLTAIAMLGYAQADSFWEICLFSLPLGFGAGAIDTGLNNYVALHYSARHMSWLHAVWGVGASVSPLIMSFSLSLTHQWQSGYWCVGLFQLLLALGLFLSIPLWKRAPQAPTEPDADEQPASREQGVFAALKTKGIPSLMGIFFAYGALEIAASLWSSSYLVEVKGLSLVTASAYAGLFFVGVMSGRFLNGCVAPYCSERTQILGGVGIIMLGAFLLWLSLSSATCALTGLLLVGLGGAPIFPALSHAVPRYFGEENSLAIMGLQTAFSYLGATLMPPCLGVIAQLVGLRVYPLYLCFWALFVYAMMQVVQRVLHAGSRA